MKRSWLSCLVTGFLCALPAHAQSYAMLGPGFGDAAAGDSPAAQAIIARARDALTRPPAPIPVVHTEGTLPGKGIREESSVARRDIPITQDLAMAWRFTGDRRYLDQAARYLDAWITTYRISLNPIDETWFDRLLFATDLVEKDLPSALQARLNDFWRRMAIGYLDAMSGKRPKPHTNWQSHRVKLATMAAFQGGDPVLISRAREAFRAQVSANIRPDGSTFDFHERDALHYVTYDLDPLLMAAITAKVHGENWYAWKSPSGSSLKQAVTWLEPYARGDKVHIEFVRSKIAFDRERAAAGQTEYKPHPWSPANAVPTFALAAFCDPALKGFSEALATRTGGQPAEWISLFSS
ncbi:alginate lyase family protein [Sphingomonas sp.]|uniref:alginate lyase family protein n=1 Tax=Sphingomonas sp. TaxID=28214 RepID=UPI000DB840DA|nr:alginate lyase family protein [Sphingomonas sp.]PZU08292.1 MAG: alginate lyase [Sphingomonas sp.]